MKFEWEKIAKSYQDGVGGCNTHRAKVFGGWVLSNDIYTDVLHRGNERSMTTSLCFIPDALHEWVIE